MVVLLLSARSAEPPHSSGRTGARAVSTLPLAARVASEFGLPSFCVGKVGIASAHPSGSVRVSMRSKSALRSLFAAAQASNRGCHCSRAARPRSSTLRACARTFGSTGKCSSGSKPRTCLVARTSSSPRAEPCALPVFCLFGAGQPMIVRTEMIDGRPVSACAAAIAASSATTSSPESTRCVCQP